jgi:segregation and condensation protein A
VKAGFDDAPEQLVLELDGYEGPIDLLLTLAREQKVDLGRISILALADQYLAFIARQRTLRIEIAADYLVMAAWLAYLKSRLLLPQPPEDDEPSAAELAAALQQRLKLLEAMQTAGRRLMARPRLGHDVFLRGAPEGLAESQSRSTSSASMSCCAPMARAAAAAPKPCWRSNPRSSFRWMMR